MTKTGIKNPAPNFVHLKKLHDFVIEQKKVIGIEGVREIIQPYLTKQYTYDLFNDFGFEYAHIHSSSIFTTSVIDQIIDDAVVNGVKEFDVLPKKYTFLEVKQIDDIKNRRYLNSVSYTLSKVLQRRYRYETIYRSKREFEVKKTSGKGVLYNPRYTRKIKTLKLDYFNDILELIDGIEYVKARSILTKHVLEHFSKSFSVKQINQLEEKNQILQNILDKENEAVKETRNPLLIEGKAPNILERYIITDKLLNISSIISKLNISSEDKSILLAQIMGCSKQTARELLNGTYSGRAKIRTSTIDNYISNLKK